MVKRKKMTFPPQKSGSDYKAVLSSASFAFVLYCQSHLGRIFEVMWMETCHANTCSLCWSVMNDDRNENIDLPVNGSKIVENGIFLSFESTFVGNSLVKLGNLLKILISRRWLSHSQPSFLSYTLFVLVMPTLIQNHFQSSQSLHFHGTHHKVTLEKLHSAMIPTRWTPGPFSVTALAVCVDPQRPDRPKTRNETASGKLKQNETKQKHTQCTDFWF